MRSKAEKIAFSVGDGFHLASPGGGGFGDPFARDPALVEADLNDGLIPAEAASEVYGVVAREERRILDRPVYRVDLAETHALRRNGGQNAGRD